jgi:hypothetical protein
MLLVMKSRKVRWEGDAAEMVEAALPLKETR